MTPLTDGKDYIKDTNALTIYENIVRRKVPGLDAEQIPRVVAIMAAVAEIAFDAATTNQRVIQADMRETIHCN